MEKFTTIIFILSLLVALLALADKYKLPVSVLVVIVGLGIGFFPGMPQVGLDPEVVFLLILPPILYHAASNTSWHEFKAQIKPISTLAIILVILTTCSVAVVCHFLIPGFTWPIAFLMGAIISPPDAVAATSVTKGLGLNRKIITVLEGESLLNDASALIAYRFALAALATGSFFLWRASIEFVLVVGGGVVVGFLTGYAFVLFHRRILNNSIISTSLSLLTPFVAYLLAERIHVSGVLSVVAAGLVLSWRSPDVFSHHTRIRHKAVWDTLIFLLTGFVFILIGLQFKSILSDLVNFQWSQLLLYALVVSLVTIGSRLFWVFGAGLLMKALKGRAGAAEDLVRKDTVWKSNLIVAWTGTRGVVSLATALALPLTMNGDNFPHRSLILFLAFVVVFVTIVVQGLTLPFLIRLLAIEQRDTTDADDRELRLMMARKIVHFIVQDLKGVTDATREKMESRYMQVVLAEDKRQRSVSGEIVHEAELADLRKAQLAIHNFQRQLLLSYHRAGKYKPSVLRRFEQRLDLEGVLLNPKARHRGV